MKISLFWIANATQENSSVEKPVLESTQIRGESASAGSSAIDLSNANGRATANSEQSNGNSEQSALDQLLVRVDREQSAIDHRSEDSIGELAKVLMNQVRSLL